jgi:hypothetical protein
MRGLFLSFANCAQRAAYVTNVVGCVELGQEKTNQPALLRFFIMLKFFNKLYYNILRH